MNFDLATAIRSCVGDTLFLPPGDYGDVMVQGVDRSAAPLTIRPEDPKAPPTFRSLALNGCAGLAIEDLKVRFTPSATTMPHTPVVLVNRCRNVRLVRPDVVGGDAISGSPADIDVNAARAPNIIGYPTARGIQIEASAGVTVEGGAVRTFANGVLLYQSTGLVLRDLDVSDVRFHHIAGATCSDILIERPHLFHARPWKWSGPGDHGDHIHFWTEEVVTGGVKTYPAISGLRIVDPLLDARLELPGSFPIMAVFLEDRRAALRGSPGYPGLEIKNGTIITGNAQGVYLQEVRGSVGGLTMLLASDKLGPNAAPSVLYEGKTEVSFANIASHDVYGTLLTKKTPPSTYSGNTKIATTPEMIEAARKAWLAKNRAPAAPPVPAPAPPPPAPPARDELREALRPMTGAKLITPPTTKGRLQLDFKTQAQARAALAALLAR